MALFTRNRPRARIEPTLNAAPTIRASSPENPQTNLADPAQWLWDWAGGSSNAGYGPPINERTAMAVSAVFRCVTLLSGLIAGTPLNIFQDMPDGSRQPVPDHRLSDAFTSLAHPDFSLTSFAWREMWGVNLYLWGNHYSVIRRDGAARVKGFQPAYPWNTHVLRDFVTGRLVYIVNWPDGTRETIDQDNILHIPGVGFDGVRGMSRIYAFAGNSIRLSRALEDAVGFAHENAASPSGLVTLPANITPEGKRKIEAYYNGGIGGRSNRGKLLFADKDTTFSQLQLSQEDLNTIAFRKFQAADICNFFGVHPVMIGAADGVTAWGSGIAQLMQGFLQLTLNPEFQRIEAEINAKIFVGTPYYARFDRESLNSMDALASAQTAAAQIGSGQLLINESRRRQHRPPVDGGDEPLVNSTMIPLSRAINPPAPVAPAVPQKEPDDAKPA